MKNFKAFHQPMRIGKLGISITIPVILLGLALYSLPESPAVQAAALQFSSRVVTHTSATIHQMSVFGDGRISNQFLNDDAVGEDQIDWDGNDITATTIAVSFDQHRGRVDAGVQGDFTVITPITLINPSSSPGFIEETVAVYGSNQPAYQITQRTLAAAAANCVMMELIIENTGSDSLTGGKLLFMVDIDVAKAAIEDIARYDPVRKLLLHKDELNGVGYAMGMALFEGDLAGYNALTDTHNHFPDFSSGNDPDITAHLKNSTLPFTSASTAHGENLVSWLVANIDDISPGETDDLVFGLCARSAVPFQDDAEQALVTTFDDIEQKKPLTPTVTFDREMYAVHESAGAVTITVTLSHPFRRPISVDFATVTGGNPAATPGRDYDTTTGTLIFQPLDTRASFTIPILPDAIDEYDEIVGLTLTYPRSDAENEAISTTLTITDDDDPPALSITDADVTEGDMAEAVFWVSLSGRSEKVITVEYKTAPGTADQGHDYTAAAKTLTFNPTDPLSKSIAIAIEDDGVDEPNQQFSVNLTNPIHAGIADGQGVGTIIDNDDRPKLFINDITVTEGDSDVTAEFIVTLSEVSEKEITVDYKTEELKDSADENKDYKPKSGSLKFAPGIDTRSIIVTVIGDNDPNEADETFLVELSGPVNATLGKKVGKGTIEDDDRITYTYLPVVLKEYILPPSPDCTLFYSETFDNPPPDYWQEEDTSSIKTEVVDSKYHMLVRGGEDVQNAIPLDNYFDNYIVEVEVNWANSRDTGNAYGIVFGFAGDNSRFYTYRINADRQAYSLWRYSRNANPPWKPLTNEWVPNANIKTETEPNRLKVIRTGSKIALYVNDVYLVTKIDDDIPSGQIGVAVERYINDPDFGTRNADARFDNYNFSICNDDNRVTVESNLSVTNLKIRTSPKPPN